MLVDAVDEIAGVIGLEALGAPARARRSLTLARSSAEEQRLHEHRAQLARAGWPERGLRWVEGGEVLERIGATGVRGALEVRPCGTLDPVRLVRALAERVEARGAMLHERSGVVAIEPGRVHTDAAVVRAERIVVATEAFTVEQPGQGRRYLPLASTIVSTEPIPSGLRRELGWTAGEAVGDAHHLFFYAQITTDGRLTLGGRGAPYRLGSAVEHVGTADRATTARLEATIAALWPALAGVPIEHRWSGSLAVPRDWCASCGVDAATGIAWIGGYAGHGVAASYVLARSLAPLLRGEAIRSARCRGRSIGRASGSRSRCAGWRRRRSCGSSGRRIAGRRRASRRGVRGSCTASRLAESSPAVGAGGALTPYPWPDRCAPPAGW